MNATIKVIVLGALTVTSDKMTYDNFGIKP